ncbi:hypothetical protein N431DRAFT_560950 [Stipitochalara longipes BDJ]|nr:hypothetical protein N431DRAFT_560950 [Stipitochalara longipes BDJ]
MAVATGQHGNMAAWRHCDMPFWGQWGLGPSPRPTARKTTPLAQVAQLNTCAVSLARTQGAIADGTHAGRCASHGNGTSNDSEISRPEGPSLSVREGAAGGVSAAVVGVGTGNVIAQAAAPDGPDRVVLGSSIDPWPNHHPLPLQGVSLGQVETASLLLCILLHRCIAASTPRPPGPPPAHLQPAFRRPAILDCWNSCYPGSLEFLVPTITKIVRRSAPEAAPCDGYRMGDQSRRREAVACTALPGHPSAFWIERRSMPTALEWGSRFHPKPLTNTFAGKTQCSAVQHTRRSSVAGSGKSSAEAQLTPIRAGRRRQS